ncbi:MAG TPA: low affinity iron permease family protein [Pyrinomonadaceae bacterium]|nr:low affinity iron permease family protein [Pyrinomonadaceae bacterium]
MTLNESFRKFSMAAASALGSPWLFVINVVLIVIWLAAGPVYHFSDTWQLLVNTATTVFTYLAVFLIQNTQNRDAKAVHIKLDELISSVAGARNRLVDLEDLSDDELAHLQDQFRRLRRKASLNREDDVRAIHGDIDDEMEHA